MGLHLSIPSSLVWYLERWNDQEERNDEVVEVVDVLLSKAQFVIVSKAVKKSIVAVFIIRF
jgi:hypothetical protein